MKLTKQHPMAKDISTRLKKLREDKARASKGLPIKSEPSVALHRQHNFIFKELSKIDRHQTF